MSTFPTTRSLLDECELKASRVRPICREAGGKSMVSLKKIKAAKAAAKSLLQLLVGVPEVTRSLAGASDAR